jgi:hypothetical protein
MWRSLSHSVSKNPSSSDSIRPRLIGPLWRKGYVLGASNLQKGKNIWLNLSFNYVEATQPATGPARRVDKRCSTSATRRMLVERDRQLDEEESSGQPSDWQRLYTLMRCPGMCDRGPEGSVDTRNLHKLSALCKKKPLLPPLGLLTTTRLKSGCMISPSKPLCATTDALRCSRSTLTSNYLGLAPRQTQGGDFVVILHGLSIPVILRERLGDKFQLIGPCFVDGMMYGEAATWNEDEARIFNIL